MHPFCEESLQMFPITVHLKNDYKKGHRSSLQHREDYDIYI